MAEDLGSATAGRERGPNLRAGPTRPFRTGLRPCSGSWGDTQRTKAGMPGQSLARPRLRIPARARALEVIPRGRVGSCFPRTKPLLWSPQTEAPCPPDGVASGCDASPGRL